MDPNTTYKTGFAELTRELGRVPTANECLGLHDAYKRAWSPAEETILAPKTREGGPCRDSKSVEGACTGRIGRECIGPCVIGWYDKPLSGPGTIATPPPAVSEPEPVANKSEPSEGRRVAGRGPGGGVMATCSSCGQEWERPRVKGRPASKCEGCR